MDKRGLSYTAAIGLVLAVVVIMLSFGVGAKIVPLFTSHSNSNLCTQSLSLMDRSKDLSWRSRIPGMKADVDPMLEPNCPMEYLLIELPEGDKTEQENQIKRELAEAMRHCFSKTGAGSLNPFGGENWKFGHQPTAVNCISCYQIRFSKELQAQFPAIEGLTDYLSQQKMDYSDKSYMAFLSPLNPRILVHPPNPKVFDEINTSKTYKLLSYFRKGGVIGLELLGAGIGIGYSKDNMQLLLYPIEKMAEAKCNHEWS